MNKSTIKILFLLLLVWALFFLSIEFGLRWYTDNHLIYDVEMTKYSRALKIPSDNPEIGHEHRVNASATLMGVNLSINSDGFRDDVDYMISKQPGRYRMIFLGDSLTLGWGVENKETFPKILERQLSTFRSTEIFNFGIGNYNTSQEIALFFKKGLKYKPDGVVIFFFINDLEATPVLSRWEPIGNLRLVTFFWSKIKQVVSKITKTRFDTYYSSLYQDNSPAWNRIEESLKRIKGYCDTYGVDLLVVLLPELHNLKDYPFKKEHEKISGLLSRLGIVSLDITNKFAETPDARALWVAWDDAHPNEIAHRRIADYVYPLLKKVVAHEKNNL